MPRQISLSRTILRDLVGHYSMLVTASGEEVVSEIFVLQRGRLDHVASPAELADLPTGASIANDYYRAAAIVLPYATLDGVDADWLALHGEVEALLAALTQAEQTVLPETVVLTGAYVGVACQLTLQRVRQKVLDLSYLVTVTTTGVDVPSEIAVLVRQPADPAEPDGDTLDRYDRVASLRELLELPVDEPLAGENAYRSASFSRFYRTTEDADDAWFEFVAAAQLLV